MMDKLSSLLVKESHLLQVTITLLGSSFSDRLIDPKCVKERYHRSKCVMERSVRHPFQFPVDNYASSTESLSSGVPQGSVLDPLLCALHLFLLWQMKSNFNYISEHCYDDHTFLQSLIMFDSLFYQIASAL